MKRRETKLLVENWRKVLNEGFENTEKELLNEKIDLKSAILTTLMTLVPQLPGVANALTPGDIAAKTTETLNNAGYSRLEAYKLNVGNDGGFMVVMGTSEEKAKEIANNYSQNGEDNNAILTHNASEAKNINSQELAIANFVLLTAKQGKSKIYSKIIDLAAKDKSNKIVDSFNKEFVRVIMNMSDGEIESLYNTLKSVIGEEKLEKIKKFAINKFSNEESYENDKKGTIDTRNLDFTGDEVLIPKTLGGKNTYIPALSETAPMRIAIVFAGIIYFVEVSNEIGNYFGEINWVSIIN